ncbi:hypothetical protein ACFWN2_19405 [Lentzea sp. NPDC058436]|uniref:hypothetical protein n=1 Tax=Lentzea sp. NPDC058436 TaxID=3346499 RepID=UPI00364EACA6
MRALLLAVLFVLTCTPFAHADHGALVTVFWDRDTNGVRDEGEPGYRGAEIAIRDESGYSAVVKAQEDGTYRLPRAGRWKVSHEEEKFVTTTPTSVESDGDIAFGVRGAEVCGTVWLDADFNGRFDESEARVEGHRISVVGTPEHSTTTAADGTYCLHDLPAGRIRLQSEDRAALDGTAWSYTDFSRPDAEFSSEFDRLTGQTRFLDIDRPGSAVTGYDSGFAEPRGMSTSAGPITIDRIDYDGVRVGDTLIVRCAYTSGGNVADTQAATLTLPEGLKVTKAFGERDHRAGVEDEVVVDGQKVTARSKGRVARDKPSELVVHVEVQRAFAAQAMTCQAHPSIYDERPDDPTSFEIAAANEDGSGPETASAAPVWRIVLAVALVSAVVLVVVWRRRTRN